MFHTIRQLLMSLEARDGFVLRQTQLALAGEKQKIVLKDLLIVEIVPCTLTTSSWNSVVPKADPDEFEDNNFY